MQGCRLNCGLFIGFSESHNKPGNISIRDIFDSIHIAQCRVETLIDNYGHSLAPSAERRYLDLQLRHESLGAAATIVGVSVSDRKRRTGFIPIEDVREFDSHVSAGEVYRLYFQGTPLKALNIGMYQDHVDFPHVPSARCGSCTGPSQETDFSDEQRLVRTQQLTSCPREGGVSFMETIRTGATKRSEMARSHRNFGISIRRSVASNGAHATYLVAGNFAKKRAWYRRTTCGRQLLDFGELPAFLGG